MRLGIGGMLPPDPRDITEQHLRAVRDLKLTGIGSRAAARELSGITAADCVELKALLRTAEMDLVQFAVSYGECLFDPDAAVRDQVVELIGRGIEVGGALDAHFVLIRPGSLNPDGSYAPGPGKPYARGPGTPDRHPGPRGRQSRSRGCDRRHRDPSAHDHGFTREQSRHPRTGRLQSPYRSHGLRQPLPDHASGFQ